LRPPCSESQHACQESVPWARDRARWILPQSQPARLSVSNQLLSFLPKIETHAAQWIIGAAAKVAEM